MDFGKSAVFCLGIAAMLWAFPGVSSAETVNTLAAPHAGSSEDLEIWFRWDATSEGFMFAKNTIYDFVGDSELGFAENDWDDFAPSFLSNTVSGGTTSPIPDMVTTSAVASRVPEPELWVLVACGLSFIAASAALQRRSRTEREARRRSVPPPVWSAGGRE